MTWGIWAIHPNNETGLYTDADLITKGGMIDLERKPLLVEGCWFVDFEIGAIKCDKANTAIVFYVSILPSYLW